MKQTFQWFKSKPRKTFTCVRFGNNSDITTLRFFLIIWALVLAILICAAGKVFSQPVPTNVPVTFPYPKATNVVQVGSYQLTYQPLTQTQAMVDADSGIVGAVMNGTNMQVVTGKEPSFTGGGVHGVVEDTNVVVDWYQVETSTVLWSPDLLNWQPITATAVTHFAVNTPKGQQGFYEKQ